jgi:hypothetical protein
MLVRYILILLVLVISGCTTAEFNKEGESNYRPTPFNTLEAEYE